MTEDKITISELLRMLNKDWNELKLLSANKYSDSDIRNTTLTGLSNNYHDFGLRYSLVPLAIAAHKKPQNQNKDILNLTYCLNIDWARDIWDITNKRNYFLDLWGHYEFLFRVLFDAIVPVEKRNEIEQAEKDKYKKEPKKVHISINKMFSTVLDTLDLSKQTKKDFNKFTTLFLHIRNTFHNNSISSVDYTYNLLGTETNLKKNVAVECLNFERCFKFAKKSIIVVREISGLLEDDMIINPIIPLSEVERV